MPRRPRAHDQGLRDPVHGLAQRQGAAHGDGGSCRLRGCEPLQPSSVAVVEQTGESSPLEQILVTLETLVDDPLGCAVRFDRNPTAIPRDPELLARLLTQGLIPNHPWQEPAIFIDESEVSISHPRGA